MCSQADENKDMDPEPVRTDYQTEDERRAYEEWREMVEEIRMKIDL